MAHRIKRNPSGRFDSRPAKIPSAHIFHTNGKIPKISQDPLASLKDKPVTERIAGRQVTIAFGVTNPLTFKELCTLRDTVREVSVQSIVELPNGTSAFRVQVPVADKDEADGLACEIVERALVAFAAQHPGMEVLGPARSIENKKIIGSPDGVFYAKKSAVQLYERMAFSREKALRRIDTRHAVERSVQR